MAAHGRRISTKEAASGHPVDRYVGERVRARRKLLGIGQDDLAAKLGLTFQQVQKYEKGINRISSSKLFDIARALRMPVSWFFEGYDETLPVDASQAETNIQHLLITPEGIELAQAFPRIRNAGFRRQVLELVRALADDPS